MVCMIYLACTFSQMQSTHVFHVFEIWNSQTFPLEIYCGLNIEPHCFHVYVYQCWPQTLAAICRTMGIWEVFMLLHITGPCITNVFATRRKSFSQWHRGFHRKLRSHWLKFLRHVAITLVIQGPGSLCHKGIWSANSPHRVPQATGFDAWASRVKCPARFVSHLHDIWVYMSCL